MAIEIDSVASRLMPLVPASLWGVKTGLMLALPLTSCMTLGKPLNSLKTHQTPLVICKMGIKTQLLAADKKHSKRKLVRNTKLKFLALIFLHIVDPVIFFSFPFFLSFF
jgi:hypothetical protein